MATFATIQQEADERALVRKIQKAVAFLAPKTVDLPASLFDVGGALIDLKALGFLPVGLVTPDGFEFGRDVSKSDISALGYASPVRSDVDTVARAITFTALETGKKHMQELTYGTDLTAVTQDPTSGEIVIDEPDLPVGQEYRLLVIGSDGPAADNWILARGYGSVKLAATDSQTWGTGDALQQSITFDVFTDAEVGVPVKHYMGGTGAVKNKLALGFTAGV